MSSINLDEWLNGLNPEQREAALHDTGPLLILAGAGSGKTTVLVTRTGRLLAEKKVQAENVTVLTFTNKAARELKERVGHRLGRKASKIWAGTFHSFGLNLLRKHYKKAGLPRQFGIIDSGDVRALVRDLLKDHRHGNKDAFDPEKLISIMNSWRESGQTRARKEDEYEDMAELLLPKFLKKLEMLGVVDFDGLLLKPVQILQEHPEVASFYHDSIQQLMVDEFQDTNSLQMKLVSNLLGGHQNIAVVGDDDQSIYGWRGALVKNILEFPRRFKDCKVVRLERNYRSTPAVLQVANEVIKKNRDRHEKVLIASAYEELGSLPELFVYERDEDEAEEMAEQIFYFLREGYTHKDIAILYRSNSQGGLLEGVLRRQQIPYSITGGTAFFDRREVKDALAYIRSAILPTEVSFRRILNTPSRGIGQVTIKALEDFSHEHDISLFQAAKKWKQAGLNEKTGESLEQLFSSLRRLVDGLLDESNATSVGEWLQSFFRDLGYHDLVVQNYKDTATAQKRWQLIEILGRVLEGFFQKSARNKATLKEFIDCMELRDAVDEANDIKEKQKVQLLTLHACKGLEYPVVLIIGVEEDIIPHRTLGSDIDEERRLFYVGVTRAKERLVLSRSQLRRRFGKLRPSAPSRFLLEIPESMLTTHPNGCRPMNSDQRESMIADLFKKIEQRKSEQL